MNSRLPGLIIAVLLFAVACGLIRFAYQTRQGAEQALAALARQRADLDTSVRAAEDRVAAGERERAALQAAVTQMPAARPAARPAAAAKPPDDATLLVNNPELLALYAKNFRAGLYQRFGLIYQAIGATPEQVEKLNDLATAVELEKQKLLAAAATQGLDRSDPDIQAMIKGLQAKSLQSIQDIVGEPAANQAMQLLNAAPVNAVVNDAASFVALSSTPFTTAQESQLMQILANASASNPATGYADPATIKWDVALQQAQGILSPPQLAALKVEAQLADLMRANKQFYQQQAATK